MFSGVGGRESGGNSWCLHQAISITLLFRVWLFQSVAGGGWWVAEGLDVC